IGAITVWFGSPAQRANYLFRIFAPWLTVVRTYAAFWATSLETVFSLVMLFPAFAIGASLGGLVAGWSDIFASHRKVKLGCFAFMPVLFGPIENLAPVQTEFRTVASTRVVHEPREAVWPHVMSVEAIRPDELPWSFTHAIGLPKPQA